MTDEKIPPGVDLTEALARAQEPRRLWPVLHAIDAATQPTREPWALWIVAALLLIAGAALGRC
jgi:hypothetical protein